jgi:hypothetical protein
MIGPDKKSEPLQLALSPSAAGRVYFSEMQPDTPSPQPLQDKAERRKVGFDA